MICLFIYLSILFPVMYSPFERNTYQSCLYNVYCYDYNQTKQNVISNTFIYTHIFCILVNYIIYLFIDIIDMKG